MPLTTRRELLESLLSFMGERGDESAQAEVEQLLGRVVQTIWLKWPFADHILAAPFEITTIANQRSYVLPPHFGRIPPGRTVRNLTRGTPLTPIGSADLEEQLPLSGTTLETASLPQYYLVEGMQAVTSQPPTAAGDALEVLSSEGADATSVRAVVEGLDGDGIWTRVDVALAGVAPVAIGVWRQVAFFSKGYLDTITPTTAETSSAGTVTLRLVAGAVVLDKLQPWESSHQRKLLTVAPKPDGVYTLAVPVLRLPIPLLHDSDPVPDLWGPAIFEEARIEWAVNQGDIPIAQVGQIPRPCFKALAEYSNSLAPARAGRAFAG